jgi:hypothetical protein
MTERKRIHLLSEGVAEAVGGNWTLTSEIIDQLIANFSTPVVIGDLPAALGVNDRSTWEPRAWALGERAAGWIVALERRGRELWGTVDLVVRDWPALVAAFEHVSPCIQTEWRNPVTGELRGARLISCRICNDGLTGVCGLLHTAEDA